MSSSLSLLDYLLICWEKLHEWLTLKCAAHLKFFGRVFSPPKAYSAGQKCILNWMKLCHGYLFCYFQLYLWTPINLKTNLLSNTEKFSVECQKENLWWLWLILYILTSIWTFSILFSIHFLRCWQGEFVYQSRECLVCDHFLYFHDRTVWCRGYIVGRNLMLVTLS